MEHPDPTEFAGPLHGLPVAHKDNHLVREPAAVAWCPWKDAVLALEPPGSSGAVVGSAGAASAARPTGPYGSKSQDDLLAFVRICVHYVAHGAWLEEGVLLREAHRLAGIPGVLIHGRLDLSCSLGTPCELALAWPDAVLLAPKDSGHLGSMSKRERLLAALDGFAIR